MKTILIVGAGRSSSALIDYLLQHASLNDWQIIVGDISLEAARERIGSYAEGKPIQFNINETSRSEEAIERADVVISLLPASLHPLVAKHCIAMKKHFLNASYVSDQINALHHEATANNLLFLNECGLDPGIDHMSAMQVIDKIKSNGGILTSFESFTGGLIAPETDPENPWRYKFTWNPRNVVLAGQGTAKFLMEGQYKYIPYQQLFKRVTPIDVSGTRYEGYPNRDSLKYLTTYGLHDIKTMIRGTLRNAGYCSAWNVFVQLGCCDDTYKMEGVQQMTHRDYLNSFLDHKVDLTVEEKLCTTLSIDLQGDEMRRLHWSGLFSDEKIGLSEGTPAQLLEHILNKKWKLTKGDKDFIVMWHRFGYLQNGIKKVVTASFTTAGENETQTGMSKTVGLPLAIATKLLLQGKIKQRGVVLPIKKELYDPILEELRTLGISVIEKEM
ncbi:saccharopine dehydrogenase C-terminal domain-containing protein [Chryseolinea sp. H1M3-3]|uniref:saccharopine dehydrogenase family protein n=1 Tax=Chryseolinea sp. H1M3-3 TaxID=3034144 RepID=UPI0023ED59E6|nr:saccharopine dehydrogenase C-terminal domain-containing protein [Chryseolinea sp. H1M3-3]